jgi:hypothetical protein
MHLHHHHICTDPTRPSDLHVIAVISNPVRYNTRTRLFREFMDMMELSGATLWVVEAVHGNRPPSVAKHGHPNHIIVRCDHELWLKENLINIGARHLPRDAKYVMWMDADIEFHRDDWALETIETLQNHAVVQPFSHVVDYGPHHQILQTHKGFAYCYNMGEQLGSANKLGGWKKYGGPYWHPGYAFAYRVEAWNAVGGMLDRAIAGAGDYHMACGLIGQASFSYPDNVHPNYKLMVDSWGRRAERHIQRSLGYVPGTIHHAFHGKKENRKYVERWDILTKNQYDPYSDVMLDRHGVIHLSLMNDARGRALRDGLKAYFRERREDPE